MDPQLNDLRLFTGIRRMPRTANCVFSDRRRERAPQLRISTSDEGPGTTISARELFVEKMARDALATGTLEDGPIKLVLV